MDPVQSFRRLIRRNDLSQFTLGAILGLNSTIQGKVTSDDRALEILKYLHMYPDEEDVVFCNAELVGAAGTALLDQNGDPLLCMEICSVRRDRSKGKAGYRWRCSGPKLARSQLDPNRKHEIVHYNPLAGTLFHRNHLRSTEFLKLLYCYFENVGVVKAAETTGISSHTAVDYYSLFREALAVCGWHDQDKIGGPGDVVEIDEVCLVKRKHNVGRIPVGNHWVFGGTSRRTKKKFAMRVEFRNNQTLHAEIIDNIAPGTIICTDGWAAYQGIQGLMDANNQPLYSAHFVIIHQTNFVEPPRSEPPFFREDIDPACRDELFIGPLGPPNPTTGRTALPFRVHTQACERQWRDLRKSVQSSSDFPTVDRYIGAWLYRQNILKQIDGTKAQKFMRMVQDICRVYPGINGTQIKANRPGARQYPANIPVDLCECDTCST